MKLSKKDKLRFYVIIIAILIVGCGNYGFNRMFALENTPIVININNDKLNKN